MLCAGVAMGRSVMPLNEGWRIFSSSANSGDNARYISLPYSWDQSPSTPVSLTMANYLRNFTPPIEWQNRRVYIKMHGVQSAAALFINGHYVGEHRGGSTAFLFDITSYLIFEEENSLVVRVSSAPQNDLLPTSVEHAVYGGIYRNVELIITPEVAIEPNFYGSDGMHITTRSLVDGNAIGDITMRFSAKQHAERAFRVWATDRWGVTCFEHKFEKIKIDGKSPLVIPFNIPNADLWSPSNPALYTFHAELSSVIDKNNPEPKAMFADNLAIRTGLRVIKMPDNGTENANEADTLYGGLIKLNGEPIMMHGVALYHDHPIDGAAITKTTHRYDIKNIKEIGANAVRSAIVPHSKDLYDLCDENGIMAWVDTPLSRAPYLSDVEYFPTDAFRENGLQQLREIIYQNYNHPSILMWGIFSMIRSTGEDSTPYLDILNNEAHKIDPSRPTVALSNQNGSINSVTDLIVWRQNIGWESSLFSDISLWQKQLHERWSNFRSGVLFGESGCVEHQSDRSKFTYTSKRDRSGWYPEARQSSQHETYMQKLGEDSLFWGIWLSALYDYKAPRTTLGENVTGLIDFQRRNRKDAFYLYRALWRSDVATLHIADKRNPFVDDSIYTLRVYGSDTLLPRVIIRDDTLTMRQVAPGQFIHDSIKVSQRTPIIVQQRYSSDSVTLFYNSPLKVTKR